MVQLMFTEINICIEVNHRLSRERLRSGQSQKGVFCDRDTDGQRHRSKAKQRPKTKPPTALSQLTLAIGVPVCLSLLSFQTFLAFSSSNL